MTKLLREDNLGNNIQRIRLSRGMTQAETVRALQIQGSTISRSTYSLIEMGRCNIFISDLVGLKHIFNASFDEFFEGISGSRKNINDDPK